MNPVSRQGITLGAFRCQQDLQNFKDDHGGEGNGNPNTNFFDGQPGPGADKKTDHLAVQRFGKPAALSGSWKPGVCLLLKTMANRSVPHHCNGGKTPLTYS